MAYFSKDEARQAAQSEVRKNYRASAKNIFESVAKTTSSYDRFDVFLSHSINDADLVLGVKVLLEQKGLKAYFDWHDDPQASRENVTSETAELLRKHWVILSC